MKLFLDSANLDEIREVAGWGVLDGVTTNPSLCSKESVSFEDNIRAICALTPGPVSAECVSLKADEIVVEARALARIAPNIAVKIPVCLEGLKATKTLHAEGIAVNMTLVFSSGQALLAAKAGATYMSPFIGRLDDVSQSGMEIIRQIKTIYGNYGYKTEILAASIRHPMHVVEAALAGSDVATMPFSVIQQLVKHPLTDAGLKKFLSDWERVPR